MNKYELFDAVQKAVDGLPSNTVFEKVTITKDKVDLFLSIVLEKPVTSINISTKLNKGFLE